MESDERKLDKTTPIFDVWQSIGRAHDIVTTLRAIQADPRLLGKHLVLKNPQNSVFGFTLNEATTDDALLAYFKGDGQGAENLKSYITLVETQIRDIELATARYMLERFETIITDKEDPNLTAEYENWKTQVLSGLENNTFNFQVFMLALMQTTALAKQYQTVANEDKKQAITQSILSRSVDTKDENIFASLVASVNPRTQRPSRNPNKGARPALDSELFADGTSLMRSLVSTSMPATDSESVSENEDFEELLSISKSFFDSRTRVQKRAGEIEALEALYSVQEGPLKTSIDFDDTSLDPARTETAPKMFSSMSTEEQYASLGNWWATHATTNNPSKDTVVYSTEDLVTRVEEESQVDSSTLPPGFPINSPASLSKSRPTLTLENLTQTINKAVKAVTFAEPESDSDDLEGFSEVTSESEEVIDSSSSPVPVMPENVRKVLSDEKCLIDFDDTFPDLTEANDPNLSPVMQAHQVLSEIMQTISREANLKHIEKLYTFRRAFKELFDVEAGLIGGALAKAEFNPLRMMLVNHVSRSGETTTERVQFVNGMLENYQALGYMFRSTFSEVLLMGENFVMALDQLNKKLQNPKLQQMLSIFRELAASYEALSQIIEEVKAKQGSDEQGNKNKAFLNTSAVKLFHPVQTFMRFPMLLQEISKQCPMDVNAFVAPEVQQEVQPEAQPEPQPEAQQELQQEAQQEAQQENQQEDQQELQLIPSLNNLRQAVSDATELFEAEAKGASDDQKDLAIIENVKREIKLFQGLSARAKKHASSPKGTINKLWKSVQGGEAEGKITGEDVKAKFADDVVSALKKTIKDDGAAIKTSHIDPTFSIFVRHYPKNDPKMLEKLLDGSKTRKVINAMQPEDEAARRLMYLVKVINHLKANTKPTKLQHKNELDKILLSAEAILKSGTYNKLDSAKLLFNNSTNTQTCLNFLLAAEINIQKIQIYKNNPGADLRFEKQFEPASLGTLPAITEYVYKYQQKHLKDLPLPEALTDDVVQRIFPGSKNG